jgi:SAM-dependent methyltransferase
MRVLPDGLTRAIRRARGQSVVAPPGRVDFGDLRRTTPIATDFGYGRGGPVDRHYIEAFLELHGEDIRGRVLEVGDDTYTRRYGAARVERADILHVTGSPEATYVGDLADGAFLPSASFDCVVLTQTLQFVYDFAAALRTIRRVLAPGGTLLLTVPGFSNVDRGEWSTTWYYSFTEHAVRRACADAFPNCSVEVTSHGNALTAVAFLHGLGARELTGEELEWYEPGYALVHCARVVTPSA